MDDPIDPQGEDSLDERLRSLLAGLGDEGPATPAPDPGRVAAHLAGVGDEELLLSAARDPAVRRILADVVAMTDRVDEEVPAAALGPDARARAIAAFAPAPAAERADVREVRALDDVRRPRIALWARVAAAVLLVAVPAGVVVSIAGRRAEAGPVLAVEAVDRIGRDGSVWTEGPRALVVGARVLGDTDGRTALRMEGGATVILGGGDQLRVACDAQPCRHAVLALDRGEAVVAASKAGVPSGSVLLLPDGGRVEVVAGAAQLTIDPDGAARLALREDARALWTPRSAATPRPLAGPATLRLRGTQVLADAFPPPGGEAFGDVERFVGRPRRPQPPRQVSSREWRVLAQSAASVGPASRTLRGDLAGQPALRMDLAPGGEARLGWLPDREALGLRALDLLILAVPSPEGRGTVPAAGPGRVTVEIEGVAGAQATLDLGVEPGPAGAPARPRRVTIPLPSRFGDSLRGGEMVLRVRAQGGGATVWFQGAAFPDASRRAASSSGAEGD